MKKVSVCIPSYNAARFIGETIKSVLDSAYQNLEIIVNDDASTDNTREVVQSFNDCRVLFYQNEENVGPVKNWNRAIAKASGEYVGLLNHDDLYGPFWLTFAIHQMEKQPHLGWAATAYRIIDDAGHTFCVISRFPITGEISRTEAFLQLARLDGLGPGYITRREIMERVGYYDEDAGPSADNDLFLRLASRYPLFYSSYYPHTSWRQHSGNLTHRWGAIAQVTESLRILDKIFSDDALPEDLRQYKDSCMNFFFHKALSYTEKIVKENNPATYNEIISILKLHGYAYHSTP